LLGQPVPPAQPSPSLLPGFSGEEAPRAARLPGDSALAVLGRDSAPPASTTALEGLPVDIRSSQHLLFLPSACPASPLCPPLPRSSFSFSSVLLAFPVGPASGRDQWATSALFPFVCPALLLCCPRARGERRFSDFVNRSQVDPVLPQRRNGDGTREYKSTTGRSSPVLRCCFSALSSSSSLRGRVGSLRGKSWRPRAAT